MAFLVGARGGVLGYAHVPRIERRRQALDRAALAGGVPALEDDAERRPQLFPADQPAKGQPQLRQPLPGQLQLTLFLLAAERETQVDLVEVSHTAIVELRERVGGDFFQQQRDHFAAAGGEEDDRVDAELEEQRLQRLTAPGRGRDRLLLVDVGQ